MIKLNKTDEEIMDNVNKILEWYAEKHTTSSIDNLLAASDKLSLYAVNLAHITSVNKDTYLRAYLNRKWKFSKRKLHYINSGEKIGFAEEKATLDLNNIREEEIQSEILVDRLDLALRQVNAVIRSMQQRISFLKIEKNNSDNGR
tara:strand:+ start:25 stop:459 length:435 start_codon:yes stop_codon:yes gene_type:complete